MNAAGIGIDAGSTTLKGVAIDAAGQILARRLEAASPLIRGQAARMVTSLIDEVGKAPVATTGYGRKQVEADCSLTEITCHARGAWLMRPKGGLLVDVGGQDTKVIRLGATGEVLDFAMNDKCAAGTGRFLEVILGRLQVPFDDVEAMAAQAEKAVAVSSTCTVFAESEVISLVAQGAPLGGIIRGLHEALASRVAALAGVLPADLSIIMSGGVALNAAMVAALSRALGRQVSVLPEPQMIGALGAALTVARG